MAQHKLEKSPGRLVAFDDADALASKIRDLAELAVARGVAVITVVTIVALCGLGAFLVFGGL